MEIICQKLASPDATEVAMLAISDYKIGSSMYIISYKHFLPKKLAVPHPCPKKGCLIFAKNNLSSTNTEGIACCRFQSNKYASIYKEDSSGVIIETL